MTFLQKIITAIEEKNSLLCIGLDTDIDKIPESLRSDPDPLFSFNRNIIDATVESAAAYKINLAFYEAYGIRGWQALQKTFDYLAGKTLTIADAKRGDIGNTAKMYARAIFSDLGADAVTLNPLMGKDSILPFLEYREKGSFCLCLTSNPGSKDFQYFSDGNQTLYEKIASRVREWNVHQNCGLVVGATHAREARAIRTLAPDLPFLIPGIGAQGGDIESAVHAGTDARAHNALFNSSRAIIYASSNTDFQQRAYEKAEDTRQALNQARQTKQ